MKRCVKVVSQVIVQKYSGSIVLPSVRFVVITIPPCL
ncbi:hypothetical protein BU9_CDS0080 [Klebsiella phage Kpn BU9]|nr:hypothetical protein BU9_CDS0080 [Klebsiella phage Kpn BU9]